MIYSRKVLIVIWLLICFMPAAAQDGCPVKAINTTVKPGTVIDWYVIDTGNLLNYVSNSTTTFTTGNQEETFLIGRDDLAYPSMQWKEFGYENNNYLYFGSLMIGYNNNEIRFSTGTSHDFTVSDNHNQTKISYSMTDEYAGENHVGVRCINNVYAFKEEAIDDFIIYEYLIINESGMLMDSIYVGLHIEADISSAAGGTGDRGFWRDDMPGVYFGTDRNGNRECISYMYDADNPNIPADDTGGILQPLESTGYIGSRILHSPPATNGAPANQQTGHQWWDW